jgi:hypothetical protein
VKKRKNRLIEDFAAYAAYRQAGGPPVRTQAQNVTFLAWKAIAYRKGGLGTGAIPNTTAFALSKV